MDKTTIKETMDNILEKVSPAFNTPSISLSLHVDNEDYYANIGLSNIKDNIAAKKDVIYAIASASKAFISTSIGMLCEEGKMDLDMPIKTYIPDFEMYNSYLTNHLTVRDALSHRTGLSRNDFTWFNHPDSSLKDMVDILRYLPPAYEPRYRMHYQNHMFTLATYLVETVSGMYWKDFLATRIFTPLQMNNTFASGSDFSDDTPKKARPYKMEDEKIIEMPYRYLDNVGSTGSIYSTTEDLLKWAKFHLYGNEELISTEILRSFHSPQTIIKKGDLSPVSYAPYVDFESYGMGWFVESYRGHKLVHHGGTIDGFKSIVGFVPNKNIAFSVLSNLNRNQSPTAITYMLMDALLGLEYVDWPAIVTEQSTLAYEAEKELFDTFQQQANAIYNDYQTSEYVGKYHHPAFGEVEFLEIENELFFYALHEKTPVKGLGKDEFILKADKMPGFSFMYRPFTFGRENNKITKVFLTMDDKVTTPFEFTKIT